MDVLALFIAALLIFLLMRGCLPLTPQRRQPARTYIRLYLRCIFNLLVIVGIIVVVILHDSIPLASIGLQLPTLWWPTLLALIGVLLFFALHLRTHLLILKRMPLKNLQQTGLALPRSRSECLLWMVISIITGIWEEVLFRGLLPWYITHHITFFGSAIPYIGAAIFSLLLFSVGHFTYTWRGVVVVGIIGIIYMALYALTGNLFAAILWHILFDMRMVFGNTELELQKRQRQKAQESEQEAPLSSSQQEEMSQAQAHSESEETPEQVIKLIRPSVQPFSFAPPKSIKIPNGKFIIKRKPEGEKP
ncbi:hypothetical protein KSF_084660 [Reticulibacter mediterranei]|uniref:CAAX prenyl protease 2/Lysostaphin resistance protein A-like domain-containing protein n=1 Tax=Reticulibacter mediterranei TaxID=2778369 RepID=A0A8J3IQL3_9CHLR|nr:CPBP family intramembrane glutamic endopeptidase [Reticulibacter mediterranei]GHO98418.1 hypothetical protein KSF_084660 [Reticulibacter mediterranei]